MLHENQPFHDRQYIVADGFFQYFQPTESTDDNGNLINVSKYSTLLPIYNPLKEGLQSALRIGSAHNKGGLPNINIVQI